MISLHGRGERVLARMPPSASISRSAKERRKAPFFADSAVQPGKATTRGCSAAAVPTHPVLANPPGTRFRGTGTPKPHEPVKTETKLFSNPWTEGLYYGSSGKRVTPVHFTHPVPFAKRVDGIGRSLDIGTSFPWLLQRHLATQRYPSNITPSFPNHTVIPAKRRE